MTFSLTLPTPVRVRRQPPAAVPVAIGLVVVLRLLLARSGASPDEGGLLLVAGQWHPGGTSLYGDYWVDRPPLLIGIFRLASLTGGLLALRVIGALAAAISVAVLASAARRAFGRRAATWTGLVAAALVLTPLFGAYDVNAELLALPFVALGIRAAIEAVMAEDRLLSRAAGFGAGLAAMSALLVKQNIADVFVFTAVCWILAWRRRLLRAGDLRDLVGWAAFGSALAYAVVSLSAMAHGSSPYAVYEATYPLRAGATRAIDALSSAASSGRLEALGLCFLLSGAPLLLIAFGVRGVRHSRAPGVVWGLVAVAGWDTVSVIGGGSSWLHNLIESVPVIALSAGALSLHAPRLTRALVAVMLTSSLVAAGAAAAGPGPASGTSIGDALKAAARPRDTVVSLFGDAEVVRSSGLNSPYPYLSSLPSRALDPGMTLLRAVLSGTEAPTWLVTRDSRSAQSLTDSGAMAVIERRYRVVGELCGRAVYLLRDQQRPVPVSSEPCTGGPGLP